MVTPNFLPPLVEWGVFAAAVALLTGSTAGNKRGPTVAVGVLLACAFLCGIVLTVRARSLPGDSEVCATGLPQLPGLPMAMGPAPGRTLSGPGK